ncbi:MAG: Nif11-like leader peptide family natural product precursor [Clostridia bacterium]|nr:Nif11-like leader peptide family natural product precursor [Clostridia bacterium]
MNIKKISEVFSDEVFVKSLFEMDTVAEVQAALKEKGIEMTEDEILSVRDLLCKVESGEIDREQLQSWAAQAETGELSGEALENVAGGFCTAMLAAGAIAAAATLASAAAVGGIAYGIVCAIKDRW